MGKISRNYFKYFLKLYLIWEKDILKKNPRIVQTKFILKFFYLKKPYKKIANNLCNKNPWINNIP